VQYSYLNQTYHCDQICCPHRSNRAISMFYASITPSISPSKPFIQILQLNWLQRRSRKLLRQNKQPPRLHTNLPINSLQPPTHEALPLRRPLRHRPGPHNIKRIRHCWRSIVEFQLRSHARLDRKLRNRAPSHALIQHRGDQSAVHDARPPSQRAPKPDYRDELPTRGVVEDTLVAAQAPRAAERAGCYTVEFFFRRECRVGVPRAPFGVFGEGLDDGEFGGSFVDVGC
jgi:hypothetical protein